MWPFSIFRKKKVISLDVAAASLDFQARIGLVAESFPAMAQEEIDKVNTILYFTKAATIIHWLRLCQRNSGDEKWAKILRRFEAYTFPENPVEGVVVVKYVNDLIELTCCLQKITEKSDRSDEKTHIQWRLWWEEWLDPISSDKQVVQTAGNKFGLPLLMHIHSEINELGKLVQNIGKDTVG